MRITLITLFLVSSWMLYGQQNTFPPELTEVWEPEPRPVATKAMGSAPSDAQILLGPDGPGAWAHQDGSPVKWDFKDGVLTVKGGTGAIFSKDIFGDVQLHVEWRSPTEIVGEGQGRGNSGIFLQNRYEVQVLDSYNNRTYSNGQAASVYKQHIPLVNAMKPTGEWQTYDIIYKAPTFNADGIKTSSAYLTVIHNGVLVQNHVEIKGTSEYIGYPKNIAHGEAPFQLQDHGNPVSYRNIWVRRL